MSPRGSRVQKSCLESRVHRQRERERSTLLCGNMNTRSHRIRSSCGTVVQLIISVPRQKQPCDLQKCSTDSAKFLVLAWVGMPCLQFFLHRRMFSMTVTDCIARCAATSAFTVMKEVCFLLCQPGLFMNLIVSRAGVLWTA